MNGFETSRRSYSYRNLDKFVDFDRRSRRNESDFFRCTLNNPGRAENKYDSGEIAHDEMSKRTRTGGGFAFLGARAVLYKNPYLRAQGAPFRLARAARLSLPQDTMAVNGELFILDWNNHRIRKVDASGTIGHVAGRGELGGRPR